jgi:hypothetical protein
MICVQKITFLFLFNLLNYNKIYYSLVKIGHPINQEMKQWLKKEWVNRILLESNQQEIKTREVLRQKLDLLPVRKVLQIRIDEYQKKRADALFFL